MSVLTIGELRRALAAYADDDVLHLPGGLTFYRIKRSGDDGAILEVNEPLADLASTFKKRNPHVKCAFIECSPLGEGDVLGGFISVTVD